MPPFWWEMSRHKIQPPAWNGTQCLQTVIESTHLCVAVLIK